MSKTVKQICKCENCGNEAEMEITCSLSDFSDVDDAKATSSKTAEKKKVKGSSVCSNCGNEADMWIDV